MDSTQNNLNYISCPNCLTLFKPKIDIKLASGMFKCVGCGNSVNQTNKVSQNNSSSTPLKFQAKINSLPTDELSKLIQLDTQLANHNHASHAKQIKQTKKSKKNRPLIDSYLKTFKLKSRMLFLLWILLPMFFLDLLVSTVIKHKDELAQNDRWREPMLQFCKILNCELPTYSNLTSIVIEDNALIASETQKNAIQLHAMLNNTANFDQKYPNLKINFTDINGNLIAKKIITPEQYLKNYTAEQRQQVLQKNSKQYVSILIDDPGQSAVNYEIDLTS